MVAQSLNLGQVLSLGKTCGSVRSPCGSPRHGEGPQGATTARLDVTLASNALTHLVLLLLHRARSLSRLSDLLTPMYCT
jgi:hypothetical protein